MTHSTGEKMAEELIDVAAPEGGESTVDTGDGADSCLLYTSDAADE